MDENKVLIGEQLEEAVQSLNVGWTVLPGKGLVRVIPTVDFNSGFKLIAQVAQVAEQLHFEPELTLRRHEVEISLPAYEGGGVTWKDVVMASKIDTLL